MSSAGEGRPGALPQPRLTTGSPATGDLPGAVGVGRGPFVHAASVVSSDPELYGVARRWAADGIDGGDLLVVAGTPSFRRALAAEFGGEDRVEFDDRVRPNSGRPPDAVGAIIALSRQAAAGGSGRLRILAQVDQPSDPRAVREFACLESASNLMPIDAPVLTLCVYDDRRLAPELVASAAATHPNVFEPAGVRASGGFVEPHHFVGTMPVLPEPLQDDRPLLAVDDAPRLADLRHALGAALQRAVPDRDQRDDVHLAVSEMAANAFRHGARPVSVRLWATADRLVCTVSDGGGGIDPLRGYWPAHGQDLARGGMGLWLARKLCDHVDLVSDDRGTTVRLATALR